LKLELEELTGKIIGCAIEVHRELGPGFLESIYEAALVLALRRAGLSVERQRLVPINFRNEKIGEHRLDLCVERSVVVELKAIKALEDVHFAIVRSYLKACGLKHGLLLNFSTMPLTIKRVIFDPQESQEVGKEAF
jgi:GxxExxY protein